MPTNTNTEQMVTEITNAAQRAAHGFTQRAAFSMYETLRDSVLCFGAHGYGSELMRAMDSLSDENTLSAIQTFALLPAFQRFDIRSTTARTADEMESSAIVCHGHAEILSAVLSEPVTSTCARCAVPAGQQEYTNGEYRTGGFPSWAVQLRTTTGTRTISQIRATDSGTSWAPVPRAATLHSGTGALICANCHAYAYCTGCEQFSSTVLGYQPDGSYGYGAEWQSCARCDAYYHPGCADHSAHITRADYRPRGTMADAFAVTPIPGEIIKSTRFIGCEIETGSDDEPIEWRPIFGVDANATNPVIASIGTDGSINMHEGAEIRSFPIGGADAERFLADMRRAIPAAGAQFDLSTGGHVHFDVRDAIANGTQGIVLAALIATDAVFYGSANPERWGYSGEYGCEYARPNEATQISSAIRGYLSGGTRYRGVNGESIGAHRTIEVRAFGGDNYESESFPHVIAYTAALIDLVVANPDDFRTECARWSVADIAAIAQTLVTIGSLSAESARIVERAARVGTHTLNDAQNNVTDSDDYYCGNCGDYTGSWCYDCDNCSSCCDC